MKERLETFMSTLNKSILVQHAEHVIGQKFSISEPFSAGQYWVCFELISADGSLVIARVRLPRHPDSTDAVTEQSEIYSITCEVATMTFLREKVTTVPFPCLYVYAGPGSQWAVDAGAAYMLIEGFYGNTIQDIQFDICQLPVRVPLAVQSFVNNIKADIHAGAYHQAMDSCSGRASDFHIPSDWLNLFLLKNKWRSYWRAIHGTSSGSRQPQPIFGRNNILHHDRSS